MRRFMIFFIPILFLGCSKSGSIPIVGLDENNQEFSGKISKSKYRKRLKKTLFKIDEQILPVLERRGKANLWELKDFSFDIGIQARAGIGSARLTGKLGLSATFSKSQRETL